MKTKRGFYKCDAVSMIHGKGTTCRKKAMYVWANMTGHRHFCEKHKVLARGVPKPIEKVNGYFVGKSPSSIGGAIDWGRVFTVNSPSTAYRVWQE